MRIIAALAVIALLTVTLVAQRGGGQNQAPSITETKVVTAAEVAALVAGTPKDRNGNANMIRLTPYNVNMEHRILGQGGSVHENEAELFYVMDGAGTLLTGGKLNGTTIEGGVSRRVAKGDWIMVPAGVPHQYPAVEAGGLTLMALHLPKKIE
jgi:mannose-6-phosphate isomerase-like protein (cupin superfamily)